MAEHGDPLAPGVVLIAPPGAHLLVDRRQVVLAGGPRENRARPSVNRLFSAAARHHDAFAIGVLLAGLLDDGVAGMAAIKAAGGVTVAQDPAEAEYDSIPRAAIAAGVVDHVVSLAELPALIERLVREPAARATLPDEIRIEAALDLDPEMPEEAASSGPRPG